MQHTYVAEGDARGVRVLLWASLAAIAALLVWASLGQIDEAVLGQGKVVPASQVQVIQSLDGGVVKQILVKPGQEVEPGQVLIRIDPTRFNSSLGENTAEYLSLLAKAARLQALATGEPFEAPPEVEASAPNLVQMEYNNWQSRTNELNATLSVAHDQLRQRQEDLRAAQAQRDQAASSCSLTTQELNVTRPLLASGAVSKVDLLRLQRQVAQSCGELQADEAQISRSQAAIAEAQTKIQETELNVRNQARSDLSDVNTKLRTLRETKLGLADRVKLSELRSPVHGTVKSLLVNTVGGVIQPGKEVMEIVPTDDTLLLEVRIAPRDIGFLHVGQKAEVKFTAYDFAIYGGLEGKVEQINADTSTDDKGNSYYIVRVRTNKATVGDKHLPIIPGMVADVHILTGRRTVMQYLLKPVLRAKENAFTER